MCDAGNTFPLLRRGRRHQCTCTNKQYVLPLPCFHLLQHIRTKNGRRTAAPRAARVYVLAFAVINHKAAVVVAVAECHALFLQKRMQHFTAHRAKVTCQNKVVVIRRCMCILQKAADGIRSSGGKCQENTINFCLPKISFNIAGLEHLWCECGYGEVDVKQTPYVDFIVHFTQKIIL